MGCWLVARFLELSVFAALTNDGDSPFENLSETRSQKKLHTSTPDDTEGIEKIHKMLQ